MKTFALLTLLLFALSGSGQGVIPKPLPQEAFNKMIVNDITYAIIGEATPVSGIKVDVSKPEATISSPWFVSVNKCLDAAPRIGISNSQQFQ